jgi:hypothetical protein
MNTEIKKRIVYLSNCSYSKIKLDVESDQEFINQFSYKYNIRIFKNDEIILKSEYTHLKSVPLDLYYDESGKIQRKKNDLFYKQYRTATSEKKYESCEDVHKILSLKDNQNSDNEFKLLYYFLNNEFNMKMTLEELTDAEKVLYSTNYCYGQVNYLMNTEPIKKAYSYDINSEHPFITCSENLLCPIRKGKEMMLNSISEIDLSKVGLYLLEIEFNEETKYFKPVTEKKYFTVSNYFIEILNKTNTKYSFYKHEVLKFNSIVYEKDDCINLNSLIGFEVKKLYERKQMNCELSKKILKRIMGVLGQKFGNKEPVSSYEERLKYNSCFIKTPNIYFRFYNFIYDFCRINLYKYIEYCHQNDITIYRIKADNIQTSKKLPDNFVDDKQLGMFKYEGKYKNHEGFNHVNDTSYKLLLKK